jgi:hypothetical protein
MMSNWDFLILAVSHNKVLINKTQQDVTPHNKKDVEVFMMRERQIFSVRHKI